jgi:hypothetical protein
MKLLGGLLLLAGLVASFPAGYDEPKPVVEPKPYVPPPPPPAKPYEPPPPIEEKPYVPPPPPPPPDKPYVSQPKPQVQPPRYRRNSPPAPPTPVPPPGFDSDQSAVKVETLAITDKTGPDTEQVTTQAATVHRERRQAKEEEKEDEKKPPHVPLILHATSPPHVGSEVDHTEKTEITVELTTEGKVRGARNVEEATTQKDLGIDKTTEGTEGTKNETGTSTPFVVKVHRERRQAKEEEKDGKKPPQVAVVLPAEITISPHIHGDHTEKTDITVELTTAGKVRGARNVEEATTQKDLGIDKTTEGSDGFKHGLDDGHVHTDEEFTTAKTTTRFPLPATTVTKGTISDRKRRQAPPAPPAVDPVEPVDPAEPVDPVEPAEGNGENGEPQEGEETGTSQPFDPNADNPPTDEEKPAGFEQNPETPPKDETGEAEENGRHARQAPETKPAESGTTEKTLLPADCIKESGTCIVFGEPRFRCCVANFKNCCTRPALVDQKPAQ